MSFQLPPPAVDEFGRQIQTKRIDLWEPRAGVAACLFNMSSLVGDHIEDLFKFYVPKALNDRNENVRSEMLRAASAAIDVYGKVKIRSILFSVSK